MATVICKLCGINIDPDFADPDGKCPDCAEAEADALCDAMHKAGAYDHVDPT